MIFYKIRGNLTSDLTNGLNFLMKLRNSVLDSLNNVLNWTA